MLSALLSGKLSIDDKLEIIETEYSIPVEDRIRADVSEMCNLSQGIREMGRMEGKAEIIINMYNNEFSMEQIVLATNKSIEEIKTIIEKDKSVLMK